MLDEHIKSFTYADLFTKKYILRTTTACFAQIWQQLTGMNTLMYYIVYVFQMAGYEGNANLIASSIKYCLNTSIAIPALYLMDKIGRRPVLLTGTALMMAWRYAIGGLLATYSIPQPINETVRISIPPENSEAATAAITCCYLFVVSFACSWGVCIWVYCAEVWGDSASRQRRAALTTLLTGFFNFAIAMFTPNAFKSITWKTYMVFGTFCACMFIHVFFFFPETKCKRLEGIGQIWEEGVPAWRSASWQLTIPILSDKELHNKVNIGQEEGNVNSSSNSVIVDEK